MGDRMRKHHLSLHYKPKIPKVISGECTTEIRKGRKITVGDYIRLYGWTAKPYWSSQYEILPYREVRVVWPITIFQTGIKTAFDIDI